MSQDTAGSTAEAPVALLVTHRTLPGRREAVAEIWMRHMAPAVQANEDHLAYSYCLSPTDPDGLSAFQVYRSARAAEAFTATDAYAAYEREVRPLLAGSPTVVRLRPVWTKPPAA